MPEIADHASSSPHGTYEALTSESATKQQQPPGKFQPTGDSVIALMMLVFTLPVLIVIAALIKLDSPGPVLFKQTRVGKNGRYISLFKFRTMNVRASDQAIGQFSVSSDPRVTRVGRVLRRTGLDELPQLLNVLSGEMRLVGPRAALPYEVLRYTPEQTKRLSVRPGITGLWQVRREAIGSIPATENEFQTMLKSLLPYWAPHWCILGMRRVVALRRRA
jgi:lipopolysaccharide/colanic/teichoic acid biosynthesis glycosyltransferase